MNDTILILDFGSQYTQLIARRVRELGVYSELVSYAVSEEEIRALAPKGIILSGGPETVTASDTPRAPQCVFELGVPVLGICYGMQTMAQQLGGQVHSNGQSEFGFADVERIFDNDLMADAPGQFSVWMSHGDSVAEVPEGFEVLAKTSRVPIVAMGNTAKQFYGLQFHPEVTHSQFGAEMLSQFVHHVCGCDHGWTSENIIEQHIQAVRKQVGDDQIILGLSGGVDSSVVAALLNRAIGTQLTCIFVDTGLLRLNEGDEVMRLFAEHLGVKVIRVNAVARFYAALAGLVDPEEKRKAVGALFVRIFEEEANALKGVKWLAQGTIYPDVIESAKAKTSNAHVIKSHHNVGGLPDDMQFELIEPLRDLFKDEVRKIGVALGLPKVLVYRHPFPGPGLCVRILAEVKPEFVPILQQADHIFISMLREAGLYDKTAQAFAVFLPVKSVGVKGDARAYEYVIALRAVETIDFMTAHWAHLPHDFLGQVSDRILNEVKGVSRVVYDISGKPPATIEWE